MANNKYKIGTIGSHSALQILRGAKDEGFETVVFCKKNMTPVYKSFGVADEIIEIKDYSEVFEQCSDNIIMIPHGSFIEHIEKLKEMKGLYYGNKEILDWESDRNQERKWLSNAGIKLPKIFQNASEIDRPVIVKFHGAQGGKGYFLARDEQDFKTKIADHPDKKYQLQEYIIGVPMYIHYFYSVIHEELEVLGFDKRYESNVDSIGRISARDQMALKSVDPSYVVVGNIPLVIRESLLGNVFDMGHKVIKESRKITKNGLFGPFCLEGVLTPEQEFYIFEISARIVAGTNPYISGSPYSYVKYKEEMSTGRRIAREIKQAIEKDRLSEIIN
ncbi:formate--phosphoribosylaminoimidazolecarboxamide ligase [Candidatus Woesearchaeota archaeon]|nr:formate--phosphoribosylaminoimidazolecarboxamide ligase [Candidatus Woesearchaeota archaeon]